MTRQFTSSDESKASSGEKKRVYLLRVRGQCSTVRQQTRERQKNAQNIKTHLDLCISRARCPWKSFFFVYLIEMWKSKRKKPEEIAKLFLFENFFKCLLTQHKLQVRRSFDAHRNEIKQIQTEFHNRENQKMTDGIILRVLELCLLNISMYTFVSIKF